MADGRANLSIHKVFAENLRLHCQRFASIAELCRLAGINRQQFNRYLSGQNLPNPRTLERLSAVLEVSEASLFETHATAPAGAVRDTPKAHGLEYLAPLIGKYDDGVPSDLRTGYYYCYAPLIEHAGFCVRMLVSVVNDGKLARFTRHTSFRMMGESGPEMDVGRHQGVVLGDVHGALLVGRNSIFPHEFSAFRVQRPAGNQGQPRPGIALLRNSFTDIGSRIALHYMGEGRAAARQALSNMGVIGIDHESVPPVVRAILRSGVQGENAEDHIVADRDAALTNYWR